MISFEIEKYIASAGGLELNLVSWNGRKAKYDLRRWDTEHEKPGKGLTLSAEELAALKEMLEGVSAGEG